jgi:hypothetical protein
MQGGIVLKYRFFMESFPGIHGVFTARHHRQNRKRLFLFDLQLPGCRLSFEPGRQKNTFFSIFSCFSVLNMV